MSKPPNRSNVDRAKAYEALRLKLALLTRENEAKRLQLDALSAKVVELEAQCAQLNESLKAALEQKSVVTPIVAPAPAPAFSTTTTSKPVKASDEPFKFFNWSDSHVHAPE